MTMNFKSIPNDPYVPVFDNELGPFVPEIWAQESLMVLENNTVAVNIVHKDFKDEVARYGEVVNTRLPGKFSVKRKTDDDTVVVQSAAATNVPVKMDQHLHTSFLIKDGEESKGFGSLREEYLIPAMESIAQGLDQIILNQAYQFIGNSVGKLGTDPVKKTVIDLKEALTTQKCPLGNRNCIVTPKAEGALLDVVDFTAADNIGDNGSVMRDGALGRTMGLNFIMSQNMPTIGAQTVAEEVVNGDHAIGDTVIGMVDTSTDPVIPVGTWVTFAGDMTPQQLTASTNTSLTITPGLKHPIASGAVITICSAAAVNNAEGYAADFAKELAVDGLTINPATGQLVSTGVGVNYGLIGDDLTTTKMFMDRPLSSSLADDDPLYLGPSGDFCFAFHPHAISLVSRPLALPATGTGALSYVAEYKGLAVRVTITYDGSRQGHLVTVDILCGVKVLNTSLGCLLYA